VVDYSFLKKGGGGVISLNQVIRPFLIWCNQQRVRLLVNLVKSEDMLADGLSRLAWDYKMWVTRGSIGKVPLFKLKSVDSINFRVVK